MRYYYYGNPEIKTVPNENNISNASQAVIGDKKPALSMMAQKREIIGDLVIEEDTVYEIDRECLKCRERNIK